MGSQKSSWGCSMGRVMEAEMAAYVLPVTFLLVLMGKSKAIGLNYVSFSI
jgi:hypothetical protein